MTVREYLNMLRLDQDSPGCNACGSSVICRHRRAEAVLAGVEGLPGMSDGPKRRGPGRSRQNSKNGEWYWTGAKWRLKGPAGRIRRKLSA